MTIQPSVIIWTVICFFVFMLVVDRLLFRPVLGMMHRRQKKIDYAAAEQKVIELRRREENQKRLKALENARQQERDRAAESVSDAKAAAGKMLSIMAAIRTKTNSVFLAVLFIDDISFQPCCVIAHSMLPRRRTCRHSGMYIIAHFTFAFKYFH